MNQPIYDKETLEQLEVIRIANEVRELEQKDHERTQAISALNKFWTEQQQEIDVLTSKLANALGRINELEKRPKPEKRTFWNILGL